VLSHYGIFKTNINSFEHKYIRQPNNEVYMGHTVYFVRDVAFVPQKTGLKCNMARKLCVINKKFTAESGFALVTKKTVDWGAARKMGVA
jgi:hypothetical protein